MMARLMRRMPHDAACALILGYSTVITLRSSRHRHDVCSAPLCEAEERRPRLQPERSAGDQSEDHCSSASDREHPRQPHRHTRTALKAE